MTDDLERRLRDFNPDDYMTEAECAGQALAELQEVLSLRGMARRNAASKFLSDFEATLRSALSSADEIARLRAEIARLRQEVVAFGGLWAVQYAKDHGLAEGELHPAHYDILAKAGGRMDNYRPAALQEGSRDE